MESSRTNRTNDIRCLKGYDKYQAINSRNGHDRVLKRSRVTQLLYIGGGSVVHCVPSNLSSKINNIYGKCLQNWTLSKTLLSVVYLEGASVHSDVASFYIYNNLFPLSLPCMSSFAGIKYNTKVVFPLPTKVCILRFDDALYWLRPD